MRVSRCGFVCLMVLLLLGLTGYACLGMQKPIGDFSYTLSIRGHSVSVAACKSGKVSLRADGKECQKRGDEWPSVTIGKMTISLMDDGTLDFCLGVDRDDDIYIEIFPAAKYHFHTKGATKIRVGNKVVFRERSNDGGDTYSQVPCYDFYYLVNTGGLVFLVSQSTPVKNQNMTTEFREVVGTLKIGRMEK